MATTTNYGWTTPNDTDLVKDGASAIRTLGSSIDTTTKALNPSTTLGDIEYRSATANTNTRLGIGSSGQVLTVASGVPAWATPAGAKSYSLLGSGTMSGATTVTVSGISGMDQIYVQFTDITNTSASVTLYARFNADSGTNYDTSSFTIANPSTYSTSMLDIQAGDAQAQITLTEKSDNSASKINGNLFLSGCNTTGKKIFKYEAASSKGFGNDQKARWGSGVYNSTSTISSVSLIISGTNFSGGTFRVYGAA